MKIHRILLLTATALLFYPHHAAPQQNKHEPSAATDHLLKGAERGNFVAQFYVGSMYANGSGDLPQDYIQAHMWLTLCVAGLTDAKGPISQKAADLLDSIAKKMTPEQIAEAQRLAKEWESRYLQASFEAFFITAENGSIDAQFNVGSMYADGRGVPRDYTQAYMWLTLCVAGSTDRQSPNLQKAADLLDSIAKKMMPEQIAEAQRLAKEWESRYVQRIGDGPFVVGSVGVTAPVVLVNPMPAYTDQARNERAEGIVVVECVVRKNGRAEDCKFIRELGYGLDESVMNTIARDWRFKPGTHNGKSVDVKVLIETSFRLQ